MLNSQQNEQVVKIRKEGFRPFANKPAMAGTVFRVYRNAPSYPGLAGRDLTPGRTAEELEAEGEKPGRPR
jgi:hypothetical protein